MRRELLELLSDGLILLIKERKFIIFVLSAQLETRKERQKPVKYFQLHLKS